MFEIETGLIIWTSVSFAILVILMYKLALPPILAMLREREKTISKALSQAEERRRRSEELLAGYRQKLAEAAQMGGKMLEEAKREGEKLKLEMIDSGRKNADLLLARAQEDLKKEKNKLVAEIKSETADLVTLAASKVIRKNLDKGQNIKIIRESLK